MLFKENYYNMNFSTHNYMYLMVQIHVGKYIILFNLTVFNLKLADSVDDAGDDERALRLIRSKGLSCKPDVPGDDSCCKPNSPAIDKSMIND